MQKTRTLTVAAAGAALALCFAPAATAAPRGVAGAGPMTFAPLTGSAYDQVTDGWAQDPLKAPQCFTQKMLSDETVLDIYPGKDDLNDMNTVNESGKNAGRYVYTTHEVGSNGAVSVYDRTTGESKVIFQRADLRNLDGIRWTPWGTLLFAEETTGGRIFEMTFDKQDPTKVVSVEQLTDAGILRHEGIEVEKDGTVYVIDELNGGSIYKFVPDRKRDLSSGQLYALKLTGLTDAQQAYSDATFTDKVGAFEWVPLDMTLARKDSKAAADAVNATEFGRPEDLELIGSKLYVANTSEDRVVQIDLKREELSTYIQAGVNLPVENAAEKVTGFNSPDNLAEGPGGQLWVVEDNYLSDIYVASGDKNKDGQADRVDLFASLKDPGAEISGIYFAPGQKDTLYFSVQHAAKPLGDGLYTITRTQGC